MASPSSLVIAPIGDIRSQVSGRLAVNGDRLGGTEIRIALDAAFGGWPTPRFDPESELQVAVRRRAFFEARARDNDSPRQLRELANRSGDGGHRHPPSLDGCDVSRVVPFVDGRIGLGEVGDCPVELVARAEVRRDRHGVAGHGVGPRE